MLYEVAYFLHYLSSSRQRLFQSERLSDQHHDGVLTTHYVMVFHPFHPLHSHLHQALKDFSSPIYLICSMTKFSEVMSVHLHPLDLYQH